VVDAIVAAPRGDRGPYQDVPVEPAVMKRVTLLPETGVATRSGAAPQPGMQDAP